MCFIWTISQTHTGGKIAARNRRDEGEGGDNGVKAGVDYALHPLPIPRRLNPLTTLRVLSIWSGTAHQRSICGMMIVWRSFHRWNQSRLLFLKKKNLVSNFLMSYQSKNKPLRSRSNKLWLLRGSVNLSCRIACMGVVSVRVRFLEGERSLRGESSTTNSSNWTFYVEKLLF